MKPPSLFCAVLVILLPAVARAELVAWSYDWGSSTVSVAAGGAGTGGISLATPTGSAAGSSDIVAVNLSTFSSALPGTDDTFSATPYHLDVKLTDAASGASGLLSFSGTFSGTLTPTSANITNAYDSPTAQSIHLGSNTYTITLGTYIAPGAPGSTTTGSIGAHVDILPEGSIVSTPSPQPAAEAPEPSSLILAGLGLLGLGGRAWRSWRRERPASSGEG